MAKFTDSLVKHFAAELQKQGAEYRGLKLFFVRRRSQKLEELHPAWTEPQLRDHLQAETGSMQTWLGAKIGRPGFYASIVTGEHDHSPKHLDLETLSEAAFKHKAFQITRRGRLEWQRAQWAEIIVWRAAAVVPELWRESAGKYAITALNELVDRRLRVVEQIAHQVNGGHVSVNARSWNVAGAKGPWKDGETVRWVEYPWLPKVPFLPYLKEMKAISWHETGNYLEYHVAVPDDSQGVPFRVALGVISEWTAFKWKGARWRYPVLKPSKLTPAETFDQMLTPSDDFALRNWLFCDQTAGAVNVEALRFAIRRREGSDKTFNEAITNGVARTPDFVMLGGVLGPEATDHDILMSDDKDLFFENIEIPVDDLQVGDHLIFWNHQIYDLVSSGAYRNEFSHVMGVRCDAAGNTDRSTLTLAGHGIRTTTVAGMQLELIGMVKRSLEALQQEVVDHVKKDPTAEKLSLRVPVVKWAPYGESFARPGAWWIVLKKDDWNKIWKYDTLSDALAGIPRSVGKDPKPGPGYAWSPHVPDDALLFPLYEPAFGVTNPFREGDAWNAYLAHRRTSTKVAPRTLNPIEADGVLAPGLFYRGRRHAIPVVRPKLRNWR